MKRHPSKRREAADSVTSPTPRQGRRRGRMAAVCALLGAASTLIGAGCFTDASGRVPDTNTFYFPSALTMSPGRSVLYVANSDFDLQFSAGWLQALDARAIRTKARTMTAGLAAGTPVDQLCGAAGLTVNQEPWLYPGPCSPFDLPPFVGNSKLIGAFASGILFTPHPDGGSARLFVPVRGDPSITFFEVDDDSQLDPAGSANFKLDCGSGDAGFCAEQNRIGRDPERTLRGIALPADPVGIASDKRGEAIVTAHQTQGAASLIQNDWNGAPELSYFAGNLASGPTEVAAITEPAFVTAAREQNADFLYRPSFAVTFRNASEIDVVTHFNDSGAVPPRPYVVRTSVVPLNIVASSVDSRGIAVVDAKRAQCEQACNALADSLSCQVDCAEQVPLQVYVGNRNPASLLIGRIETVVARDATGAPTSAFDELFFFDAVPLNFGPARVETGHVIDKDGNLTPRVFATCFDSRTVFVFDPFREAVETIIRTGRGPHDVANDAGVEDGENYSFLYVGSFTDSYLGVIDLDMRNTATFGQVVANIGVPTPPKEER